MEVQATVMVLDDLAYILSPVSAEVGDFGPSELGRAWSRIALSGRGRRWQGEKN